MPWQSTETLLIALAAYCKRQEPTVSYHEAVLAMAKSLYANRLADSTQAILAQHNQKAIVIYKSVLENVRQTLVQLKFLKKAQVSGEYNLDDALAITAYQKAEKIDVTGLPDQKTLSRLFKPKK